MLVMFPTSSNFLDAHITQKGLVKLVKSKSFLSIVVVFGISVVCSKSALADVFLNEIYYSPEQPEDGRQFIELRSSTGGAESLDNLWILEVDGDAGNIPSLQDNPGTVLSAIELNGFSTGSNGLFLWRDSATVLDTSPAAGVQGPGSSGVLTLDLFPGRVDLGFEGDENGGTKVFENDVSNFLLVENFTGAVGQDLDTDGNAIQGDGTFDITPWTRVLDALSARETGDPGFLYAEGVGGVNFEGTFGADVFSYDPVEEMWAFYDSGSGEGDPSNVGPYFANDGGGFFGASDASFADGRVIHIASDSDFLYTTPGAENISGVGGLFRGDTDRDGDVDAADIDTLYDNLGVVGTRFDVALNFGAASQVDVDALVQGDTGMGSEDLLNTEYGDADLDRDIDGADFLAVQQGFGADAGWALGDFDGNNVVDGSDRATWNNSYGFAGATSSALQAIPEPTSLGLGILGMALAMLRWPFSRTSEV